MWYFMCVAQLVLMLNTTYGFEWNCTICGIQHKNEPYRTHEYAGESTIRRMSSLLKGSFAKETILRGLLIVFNTKTSRATHMNTLRDLAHSTHINEACHTFE